VIELDPYLIDTLMPDLVGHDRQPSALLVYLLLWRLTHGTGVTTVQIPLRDIAAGTGLSKRAVQEALSRLVKRRLIEAVREGITAVAVYTVLQPWKRKS
jgi:DNA-binding GntR family transcriptional regulator